MNHMITICRKVSVVGERLVFDENGATAIEYAMIASLLSIAVVASAFLLGGGVNNLWDYVRTEVVAALAP